MECPQERVAPHGNLETRMKTRSSMVATGHWCQSLSRVRSKSGMWHQGPRGEAGEALGGRLYMKGARSVTVTEVFYTNIVRKTKVNPWFWIRTGYIRANINFNVYFIVRCKDKY